MLPKTCFPSKKHQILRWDMIGLARGRMANQVGVGRWRDQQPDLWSPGIAAQQQQSALLPQPALLNCVRLLCCSAELCSASLHCVVQPGNRISDTGQVGRLRDNLGLPGNSSSSFLYRDVSSRLVLARIRWAKTAAVCLQSDRIAWGWNHRGKLLL